MRTVISDNNTSRMPMPPDVHRLAALRTHTALAEMRNGTAREEEWIDLSQCVNIVEALGTMGKLDHGSVGPLVNKAIDGLRVAFKCIDGQMMMGAKNGHIQALTQIVAIHDEAIGKFSRDTIYEAGEMVKARILDPSSDESNGLFRVRQ